MRRVLCASVSERDATSNPMAGAIEFDMLKASLQETDEDHLGATLIRSGDSVIIRMRLFPCLGEVNLGGTTVIMFIVPGIAVLQYRGFSRIKQKIIGKGWEK